MRVYPVFCPICDTLIRDADECPNCGWLRPKDTAVIGQLISNPQQLLIEPIEGSKPVLIGTHLCVTGQYEFRGRIAGYDIRTGNVSHADLPNDHICYELATDGQLMFAGCNDTAGFPAAGKSMIALNPDCDIQWQYNQQSAYTLSPAVAGARYVYCLNDQGELHVVDPVDGRVIQALSGLSSDTRFAPIVYEDDQSNAIVILSSGMTAREQATLLALNVLGRTILWQSQVKGTLAYQPAYHDDTICVALADGLMCVDNATGRNLWTKPVVPPRVTRKGALTSAPVIADKHVLFGGGDWQDDTPVYALHCVDIVSGRLVWSYKSQGRITIRPHIIGSSVVVVDSKCQLTCLELSSGRLIWSTALPYKSATVPISYSDYIYIVGLHSELQCLRYRSAAQMPTQPALVYEKQRQWQEAATAYVFEDKLSDAGRCLMLAGDTQHALKIFQQIGDVRGIGQALTSLKQWDDAVNVYSAADMTKEAAKVLLQAGRPIKAALLFEEVDDLASAGAAYEQGGYLVEAARCYINTKDTTALQALIIHSDADIKLANWLRSTASWPLAVALYTRLGQERSAAKLLQEHGDLERAYELWWKEQNWDQCRAIAQHLRDKRKEAQVCIQQGQYQEAGRLYAELDEWGSALKFYDKANAFEGSINALEGLGQYNEAAQRLYNAGMFSQAGEYYHKAAEQALENSTYDKTQVAMLLRFAADSYAFGNDAELARNCRMAAARVLMEPVLQLVSCDAGDEMVVGNASRLMLRIKNIGYGPARNVSVYIEGNGFGLDQPNALRQKLKVLARGAEEEFQTSVTPINPGPSVEFSLEFRFETLKGEERIIESQPIFFKVNERASQAATSIHIDQVINADDIGFIRNARNPGSTSSGIGVDKAKPTPSPGITSQRRTQRPVESVEYCPKCGTEHPSGVRQCVNPACGAALCPKCGNVVTDDARFCSHCSSPLS